jgi:hypothetical protein
MFHIPEQFRMDLHIHLRDDARHPLLYDLASNGQFPKTAWERVAG